MNKIQYLLFSTILFSSVLKAQTLTDFENFNLSSESYLNGSDGSGGFSSGNIFLPNNFNTNYNSWTGWAISNTTDVMTPGPMNQFSAITGGGVDGSAHYSIGFVFGENQIKLNGAAAGEAVFGFYVTNATYTYISMSEGDGFAKQFGGPSGNDPDFYRLTIKKYLNGTLSTDSVDFYLADYRFEDNSMDYIVDEWTYVDLTSLGAADSLSLTVWSSDVGIYGMNTPAYFCIDNLTTSDGTTSSIEVVEPLFDVSLYPNPASDQLLLDGLPNSGLYTIYDAMGNQLYSKSISSRKEAMNVEDLVPGMYVLVVSNEAGSSVHKFMKQ